MDSTYPDATNIEAGAHSVWPRAGPAAVAGAAAGAAWLRTGGPDHCQQGRTQLSGEGRPDITNLLQVCIERCTRRSGCAAYCAAFHQSGRLSRALRVLFDSPRGYLAIWQRLAPNRSSWQKGSFYRAFLCFLPFGATRCGRVLCLILCRFGGVFCICCAGFCAALGGVLDGLLIVVVRHLQIMHLGDQRRVADPFADDMQSEASRQFGLAAGTHSVWLGAGPAPAAGGAAGLLLDLVAL